MKWSGKTLHMQVSVGAAKWPDDMLEGFDRADGTPATPEEVRAYMNDLKAKGFAVIPCCDNVNEKGECQGS